MERHRHGAGKVSSITCNMINGMGCMALQQAHLKVVQDESLAITVQQVAVAAVDEVCQRAINVLVSPAMCLLVLDGMFSYP